MQLCMTPSQHCSCKTQWCWFFFSLIYFFSVHFFWIVSWCFQDLRRKLPVTRTLFPWQNALQFSLTRDISRELGIDKWSCNSAVWLEILFKSQLLKLVFPSPYVAMVFYSPWILNSPIAQDLLILLHCLLFSRKYANILISLSALH